MDERDDTKETKSSKTARTLDERSREESTDSVRPNGSHNEVFGRFRGCRDGLVVVVEVRESIEDGLERWSGGEKGLLKGSRLATRLLRDAQSDEMRFQKRCCR